GAETTPTGRGRRAPLPCPPAHAPRAPPVLEVDDGLAPVRVGDRRYRSGVRDLGQQDRGRPVERAEPGGVVGRRHGTDEEAAGDGHLGLRLGRPEHADDRPFTFQRRDPDEGAAPRDRLSPMSKVYTYARG